MRYISLIFGLFYLSNINAQQFSWNQSNYVNGSGGGVFINVDGNGTDLTATGFINDGISWQGCLKTGINDQMNSLIQHTYTFSFSQPINVFFQVSDLNTKSSDLECYNDNLLFNGTPIFTNASGVTINNNLIIPTGDDFSNGTVTVSYFGVQNISIIHGSGTSCNPGWIQLCDLYFGFLSIDENVQESNLHIYPNPIDNFINLDFTKNDESEKEVRIYNLIGEVVYFQTIHTSSQIYLSDLSSGSYILEVKMGDRKVLKNIQVN